MIILVTNNLKATRIITSLDIARWYLNSDLVLICSPYKIDTLFINHHDSITSDSIRLTFDNIREVYHINIDSIIKPSENRLKLIDSIYSQEFSINYSKTRQSKKLVYRFNNSGDTIGVDTMGIITMFDDDYSDNSYFRLQENKKHIVILSLTQDSYVIDYETEISNGILELITEIKNKGQAYIDDFLKLD